MNKKIPNCRISIWDNDLLVEEYDNNRHGVWILTDGQGVVYMKNKIISIDNWQEWKKKLNSRCKVNWINEEVGG